MRARLIPISPIPTPAIPTTQSNPLAAFFHVDYVLNEYRMEPEAHTFNIIHQSVTTDVHRFIQPCSFIESSRGRLGAGQQADLHRHPHPAALQARQRALPPHYSVMTHSRLLLFCGVLLLMAT